MNKDLQTKYEELDKRNMRFIKWENTLNQAFWDDSLLTLFLKHTDSPLNWTNIWLTNLISNSTYADSTPESIDYLFSQALDNMIIKDFCRNGKQNLITLNDGSQIKFIRITDFVQGIKDVLPELLTEKRHGQCHKNSYLLTYALNAQTQLCSGFCSSQSPKQQFSHSWVECDLGENSFVLDCNYNAVFDKSGYYYLFNPQDVIKIQSNQVKEDASLIEQTSFANMDFRLYCFFPDDVRAEAKSELESTKKEKFE